jgi:hypothetical protein
MSYLMSHSTLMYRHLSRQSVRDKVEIFHSAEAYSDRAGKKDDEKDPKKSKKETKDPTQKSLNQYFGAAASSLQLTG